MSAATERARLLIEQAEALGEPSDDPLLLFSVLFGFWVANYVAFNGNVMRELAAQFLALAEKQDATGPIVHAHRIMGISLLCTGDIAESRGHYERGLARYDAAKHRALATHFTVDDRVANLSYRSWALWLLGFPEVALADAKRVINDAREIGQAATLMYALFHASYPNIFSGRYGAASAKR